jgi:hypothetical protein
MTRLSISELRQRVAEGRYWEPGYTQTELDVAQEKYGLRFPPDLIDLFRDRRPVLGYDWRDDDEPIRAMLRRPLEGLIFDLEHNKLWEPEWGPRPSTAVAREEALTALVAAAPKLIPLYGHRYLPTEPYERGNPVFSIVQADIIYYGADLEEYFDREFGNPSRRVSKVKKYIEFWSDLVL